MVCLVKETTCWISVGIDLIFGFVDPIVIWPETYFSLGDQVSVGIVVKLVLGVPDVGVDFQEVINCIVAVWCKNEIVLND